eukprot:641559-Pyramimonas_sp.AAC.1
MAQEAPRGPMSRMHQKATGEAAIPCVYVCSYSLGSTWSTNPWYVKYVFVECPSPVYPIPK